ncbi:MAG TPA: hypothetical protein PKV98_01625 [Burkholderiaceae bacterium]|nr:hypothetical protein [Burkholderiaceae bacterium]
MKALLIDPFTRTTLAVDCDGSLEAMYSLIGCDAVEPTAFDDLHSVWIDENGLGANPLNPVTGEHGQRHFILSAADGSVKLLAGRGLVLRDLDDDGRRPDVSVTDGQLKARVAFPNDPEAAERVAERVACDCFVISTEEELKAARATIAQREREILGLLAAEA